MTLVQGSSSRVSPSIHPRHPWGHQSSQQTSSFPRCNWWPRLPAPPHHLCPVTSHRRERDHVRWNLPTASRPNLARVTLQIATFRKWKWIEVELEGGADRGREGGKAGRGGGAGGVHIDSQSPKKNSWGKSDSGDPDKESHLGEHIDLIYKTSTLMQNKWRGRELVLNHKTPALLRLRWNTTYIPHWGLMCCFTARYDWGWPNSLFDN